MTSRTNPTPSDAPPCAACPWRDSNRGTRHPDGWYTKSNLIRLWQGLRNGEGMTCHPTDPDNPVSARAQAAGYRPAPPGTTPLECRGGVILQQREMDLLGDVYAGDPAAYRKARPRGLTRQGIGALVMRIAFGGVPFLGGAPMARPNLNEAVGYDPLPWTPPDPPAAGQS